ncbi:Histone-lysine N-methyltransferase [Abeliophyllum distichum]|uniref:Histone-lysine N-methyltransferase n=1 Tax=Abeliophyllum distichum TaxID=126358 RepID=A0ABD1VC47_9LAMI
MDQDLGSESNLPSGSIDKSRVLEVKPLRCLVPVFPTGPGNFSGTHIQSPIPLNSFRTPTNPVNGGVERSNRTTKTYASGGVSVEDGYADSQNQSDVENASNSGKQRGQPRKKRSSNADDVVETIVNNLITSFKLNEFDDFRRTSGDKEVAGTILLVFDLLRRRLTQIEEASPGISKHPNLTAGTVLMTKGVRTNSTKRIGHVPGVEVGDIFFFRMELCIVGLHAPIMAGIDYMSVKLTMNEEPLAVSIVSSGGYDDQGGDGNVLIYTGQGGVQRKDGQVFDQKLERGNLALEKSLHRASEVRVIRGVKDAGGSNGKIYVYDGLYKIEESWIEKNKSGCNVFKYKLVRKPGQPEAFTLWKSIQQWKYGNASRIGFILPDITSGAESLPVTLVNEVDDEKGPAYFAYSPILKYSKPFSAPKPFSGCHCLNGCQPGISSCPCSQRNGGYLPYTSLGVLTSYNSLIHECGPTCACPPNCRNRMSQAGLKVRLEVFKTKNRGWGLRSWDPIRAGGFICEYAGEVIDASRIGEFGNENEDNYIFDSTRYYELLGAVCDDSNGSIKVPFPLVRLFLLIVNAKYNYGWILILDASCKRYTVNIKMNVFLRLLCHLFPCSSKVEVIIENFRNYVSSTFRGKRDALGWVDSVKFEAFLVLISELQVVAWFG